MNNEQIAFLIHTAERLKQLDYTELQFIPGRQSLWGLFKEAENISNLFSKQKHLLFYFSVLPNLYLRWISLKKPALPFLFDFFFLNRDKPKEDIARSMGENWLREAIDYGFIAGEDICYFTLSFLPVQEYIILRDSHRSAFVHQYDEQAPHDRVYVGADSVKFVQYNRRFLDHLHFKSCLELGCGTGIQLISIANFCDKLTAIDINSRAVKFTSVTAEINGLGDKFSFFQSNLFDKIEEKFDLILANPWFIDLDKAGMEEIPDIIARLDDFLLSGGYFAIYFGSYVQGGKDRGLEALKAFAAQKKYEADFYHLGKSIEPEFLKRYDALGISHINSYYGLLKKNGRNRVTVHPSKRFRRMRDSIFLPLQRVIHLSR